MASERDDQLAFPFDEIKNFRIAEPSEGIVMMYAAGYEVARWTRDKGWMLRIDHAEVSLESTIRSLNEMQSALQRVLGEHYGH
jgi:hypothetical protein